MNISQISTVILLVFTVIVGIAGLMGWGFTHISGNITTERTASGKRFNDERVASDKRFNALITKIRDNSIMSNNNRVAIAIIKAE